MSHVRIALIQRFELHGEREFHPRAQCHSTLHDSSSCFVAQKIIIVEQKNVQPFIPKIMENIGKLGLESKPLTPTL